MSETIKVIIEISKDYYEILKCEVEENQTDYYPFIVIGNGIPLDDIDSDETRAYFDGQAYGWEEGRKALIDDVKAEIEKQIERDFAFAETETLKVPCHYGIANGLQNAIRFLDNIGKGDSE